nr:glycosyltransferase family A protein [uncultured Acetatifactor sp.]
MSLEITVFTPTYNRAYIIGEVYVSLEKQTYKNFEWLVIDDGSSDNTEDVIKNFIQENKMKIRYIKKENGGQHTALNKAIELAKGRLFMIVDSDDFLTDNALERVIYWEKTIQGKHGYAGVSGLKIHKNGKTIGSEWKNKDAYVDATNFERKKRNLLGDKAEVYYLSVLKDFYPIPVYQGENDVEKAVLWNRIANAGLRIRWFNEGIYVCEYLEDGMTRNILNNHLKNFQGYTCWKKELVDMQSSYFRVVAEASAYVEMAKKKGLSVKEMSAGLGRGQGTILLAKCYYGLHCIKRKLMML